MYRTTVKFIPALLLLVASSASAQDQAAESRWIETTGENLARFLPDATSAGLTPEQHIFKAGANDSPHKYICVLAHRFWTFDEPELAREIEGLNHGYQSRTQEFEDSVKKFDQDHKAEIDANEKQSQALEKQFADLVQQGKYQEAGELPEKIAAIKEKNPRTVYLHSADKDCAETESRRKYLEGRWRKVNFRLGTNRTLVTAIPSFHLKPSGALAGRPLYREQKFDQLTPDKILATVGLAIYLGPANYQNPHVKLGESELAVKCIFVWAWLESRPDTVQADEAAVRKILEKVDYNGLSKLIEP